MADELGDVIAPGGMGDISDEVLSSSHGCERMGAFYSEQCDSVSTMGLGQYQNSDMELFAVDHSGDVSVVVSVEGQGSHR